MGWDALSAELKLHVVASVEDDRHLAVAARTSRDFFDVVQQTFSSRQRLDAVLARLPKDLRWHFDEQSRAAALLQVHESLGTLRAAGDLVVPTLHLHPACGQYLDQLERFARGSSLRFAVKVHAPNLELSEAFRQCSRPQIDLSLRVRSLQHSDVRPGILPAQCDRLFQVCFDTRPASGIWDEEDNSPGADLALAAWPPGLTSLTATARDFVYFPSLGHDSCHVTSLGLYGHSALDLLPLLSQMRCLISLQLFNLEDFYAYHSILTQEPEERVDGHLESVARALCEHPLPNFIRQLFLTNVDFRHRTIPLPAQCKNLKLEFCSFSPASLRLPPTLEVLDIADSNEHGNLFSLQLPPSVSTVFVNGNSGCKRDEKRRAQLMQHHGTGVQLRM